MQSIKVPYRGANTSETQNSHLVGVLRAGVYCGYIPMLNAGGGGYIDLHPDSSGTSVLRSLDGRVVTEDQIVYSAVKIANGSYNATRWDLIVAELYGSTQQYKAIQGTPSYTGIPTAKPVAGDHQVALAYVLVRPSTEDPLSQTDIHMVDRATWVTDDEHANLHATILPGGKLVYISGGSFTSRDGGFIRTIEGVTSSAVSATGLTTGVTYYWLIGLEDDGNIVISGASTDEESLDELNQPYLVIARLTGSVISNSVQFTNLVYLKQFTNIGGGVSSSNRHTTYITTLGSSIFRYLSVSDDSTSWLYNIAGGTLNPNTSVVTTAGGDVYITTKDLLLNTPVTDLNHFMVEVDSTAKVTFQVSTVSPEIGFSSTKSTSDIVSVPGTNTSLYLKFKISSSEFSSGNPQFFSFGTFMNLLIPVASTSGDSLENLKYTPNNLIANGNFSVWDKPTASGVVPEVLDRSDAAYRISTDDPFGPVGWQFTEQGAKPVDSLVYTKYINGKPYVTATIEPASGENLVLEQRLDARELVGDHVTFAASIIQSNPGMVVMGIAYLQEATDSDQPLIISVKELVVQGLNGRFVVNSELTVPPQATSVSVFFKYPGIGGTASITNVSVVRGNYNTLVYTKSTKDARELGESGNAFISGIGVYGQPIGTSAQFGARKSGVGPTQVTITRNQSRNIASVVTSATQDGVVFSTTVAEAGEVTVDILWAARVIYRGSIFN